MLKIRHKPRKKTCDVYGPNAVSVRVAQTWFKHFPFRNFDVKDEPRFDRPDADKDHAILEKVEQDRHISRIKRSVQICTANLPTADETQARNREKRPEWINKKGVVFHHDIATPHTFLTTQHILKEFGWEVVMHPPHVTLHT
ncbi:hypothetical protein EVAR_8778_1 [Eumeta japonica]|uniref:Histone-lysine N-methyltransferase SETMAR n=1 Tax=Eumeta variegata TaxID=151549 RepID=A0A4C1TU35_EUMVA|nr:hypothetical protein EVAR_8778_1 [Eumeta japonica]